MIFLLLATKQIKYTNRQQLGGLHTTPHEVANVRDPHAQGEQVAEDNSKGRAGASARIGGPSRYRIGEAG